MSVMYVIVPLALAVVLAAVIAFLWAARRGQFDDLTTPAIRAIHDDLEVTKEAPAPESPPQNPPLERAAPTSPADPNSTT